MKFTSATKSVEQLFHEIIDNKSIWNAEEEEGCLFPYDLSDMFKGSIRYVAHVNIDGRNCLMWLIQKVGFKGAGRVGVPASATTQYVNYHAIIKDVATTNVGCIVPRYLFNELSQEVLREAFETVESQVAR